MIRALGRRRSNIAAVMLLAATAGCNAPGAAPSTAPATRFQKPNPVSVVERLENDATVSAILDRAGGSVTTRGSDGSLFTLQIPPGALLMQRRVSLTPVAGLDGLPSGPDLLAAAHLEPDGLVLSRPAALTITPAKAVPPGDREVGLIYAGGGGNLHPYPLDLVAGSRVSLLRIASVAMAGETRAELTSQTRHAPTSSLDQVEQQVAVARLEALAGSDPASAASTSRRVAQDWLIAEEHETVAPEVSDALRAEAGFDTVRRAFTDLLDAERTRELLVGGGPPRDFTDLLGELHDPVQRIYREQAAACFSKDDIGAGLRALDLGRRAQMDSLGDAKLDLDPVERCLRFELNFETHLTATQVSPVRYQEEIRVRAAGIPVHLLSSPGGGQALPVYLDYSRRYPDCATTSTTRVTEPFLALGLAGLDRDPRPGHEEVTDFLVEISPGEAIETATVACPGAVSFTVSTSPPAPSDYSAYWAGLHDDERLRGRNPAQGGDNPVFAISGWEQSRGGQFARRTYQRTRPLWLAAGPISLTETTTFELTHAAVGGFA